MKIENLLFSWFTDAFITFDNNSFVQLNSDNHLTWAADVDANLEQ